VNIANPYAFLHMIKAAPAHLDPTTLKKSDVEFYLSLNDDQAKVLPQNQQQTRVWIRHHVSARKARIQEEEQKRRIAQQGVGGMGFKAPLPPGMSPGLGPSRITIQNLSQEIQKYKEKEGKSISLEAVKDLCKRAGTTWTPEIERAVERFCAPPVPPKTPREVLTEQVRELSLEVLGEKMDESVEKVRFLLKSRTLRTSTDTAAWYSCLQEWPRKCMTKPCEVLVWRLESEGKMSFR
jgi:hypothetical protein